MQARSAPEAGSRAHGPLGAEAVVGAGAGLCDHRGSRSPARMHVLKIILSVSLAVLLTSCATQAGTQGNARHSIRRDRAAPARRRCPRASDARRLPAPDAEGRAALPPARHGAARDLRRIWPARRRAARDGRRSRRFYTRGDKPVGVLRVLRALDAMLIAIARRPRRASPSNTCRTRPRTMCATASSSGTRPARRAGPASATPTRWRRIVRAIRDARARLGIVGRLDPAIDREADPAAALEMVGWVRRPPRRRGRRHRHRLPRGRPAARAVRRCAYARGAPRRPARRPRHAGEFGMPWTNVQTALDLLPRRPHRPRLHDGRRRARSRRDCAARRRRASPSCRPTRTTCARCAPERWALDHPIRRMAGARPAHPSEHRRPDPAPRHADPAPGR